jgi:hypothetical protein
MYKQGSFEDELYRSMETTLVKNQTENSHGFNKLAKAADLLNTAAVIFDQAGMYRESEEVTKVLQSMAVDQLMSEAFSLSDLKGLGAHEVHGLLDTLRIPELVELAKKLSSVVKGDSSLKEEAAKVAQSHDPTNPQGKAKLVDKIMLALKVAEFAGMFL